MRTATALVPDDVRDEINRRLAQIDGSYTKWKQLCDKVARESSQSASARASSSVPLKGPSASFLRRLANPSWARPQTLSLARIACVALGIEHWPTTGRVTRSAQHALQGAHADAIDRRFSVGGCHPNSILLLGGEGKAFPFKRLDIKYRHQWVELPGPLQPMRERAELRKKDADPKGRYFSGPTLRLHELHRNPLPGTEVERPVLHLRPSRWGDFVGSNEILDEPVPDLDGTRLTIRERYADENRLVDSLDPSWVQLSNMLTAAIVVLTSDGFTLVAQRSMTVSNDAGLLSCSVGETMHRWLDEPRDAHALDRASYGDLPEKERERFRRDGTYEPELPPNPFHTVRRGVWEEVAAPLKESISCRDVEILGVGWDLKYFNPFLPSIARLDLPLADVKRMVRAQGDRWETSLLPVRFDPAALGAFMKSQYQRGRRWAVSGLTALLLAMIKEFGFSETSRVFPASPIAAVS